jgi:hypothetical protein
MTPVIAPMLMIFPLAAMIVGEKALTIARTDQKLVSNNLLARAMSASRSGVK